MSLGSVLVNTATPTLVAGDLPIGTSLINTSSNVTMWIGNSSAVATGNGMPLGAGASIQSNVTGPIWAILDNSAGASSTASLVYSTVATVLTAPTVTPPSDEWSQLWNRIVPAVPTTLDQNDNTCTWGPLFTVASAAFTSWNTFNNYTITLTYNLVQPDINNIVPLGALSFSTTALGTYVANTTISSLPKLPYTIQVTPKISGTPNPGLIANAVIDLTCFISP